MNPHLSEEQIASWIAGDRDAAIATHLRDCPQCASEIEQTNSALFLFRDVGIESAAHWSQQPTAKPTRARWAFAAAAITAAVALAFMLHRSPEPQAAEHFQRIPYVVPPAPYERTEIVRMNVPVAALIAAGLHMDTASASRSVSADILIGQDGRPLAVAFPQGALIQ